MKLYAPNSYWDATKEERKAVCNGCGAKVYGDAKYSDYTKIDVINACSTIEEIEAIML